MRLDEIVSLNTVLKSDQYIKLLRRLRAKAIDDLNVQRIKNKIIQSWKKGMKNRKHFDKLLSEIDSSVDAILQEED
jgi:argonaute-like protein implicated in RNA metabolism and viral defense